MYKLTHTLLLLLTLSCTIHTQTDYVLQWEKHSNALGTVMALNPSDGSVVRCGGDPSTFYDDVYCEKYDENGELLSQFHFTSPFYFGTGVERALFDTQGNSYYFINVLYYEYLGSEQTLSGVITFIIKTNPDGELIWEKRYSKDENHFAGIDDAILEGDNFYLAGSIAKRIVNETTYDESFVIRMDTSGTILWESFWEDAGNFGHLRVQGDTISFLYLENFGSYYVKHLNKNEGIELSSNHFENSDFLNIYDADDFGNYYLAQDLSKFLIKKYSASGDSLWQYQKEQPFPDLAGSSDKVKQLAFDEEDNIYCVGTFYTENMGVAILLTKLDQNGSLIWERQHEGRIGRGHTLIVEDNRILIGGYTYTEGIHKKNFLLLEYDTSGQFIQEIIYPNSNPEEDDSPGNMILDEDGNLFVAGHTVQNETKTSVLLKYAGLTSVTQPQPTLANLTLFPNPSNGFCSIKGEDVAYVSDVIVYNMLGQMEQSIPIQNNSDILQLNVSKLATGCYWLHVKSRTGAKRIFKLVKVE